MALANASKMKKEISEYIVAHVLHHSDILIRGSQKRQNYDNEMRQELWSNLANKLGEVFDSPMEPEKVKQHFHNRRKAVMGRVRDDLKRHGMEQAPVEEKMDWIKNRRVVVNDNDLQIIEYFFNKEQDRDTTPAPPVPLNTMVTTTEFDTTAMNFLNGLVKSEGSTCEGEVPAMEEVIEADVSTPIAALDAQETMNLTMFNNPQLFLGSSKTMHDVSSHLIIEVASKSELKRLLSLLIDNDFTRFAHFDEPPLKYFGMKAASVSQKRQCSKRKLNGDSQTAKKTNSGSTDLPTSSFGAIVNGQEKNDPISLLSDSTDLNTAANFLFEMTKIQPEDEAKDEETEEDDDMNISHNVLVDLVKSFGQPETKKKSSDGISLKCELCKNVVRLNQSGSKWNLYEHVVLNHSTQRPYKCTKCNYAGVRKGRVRQHIMSAHECDEQPENVATPDVREIWDAKMVECFPNHKQIKSASPTSVSS